MEHLKKLDVLGKTPSLLHKSNDRYQTYFGALLSVSIISMSFSLLIYFFARVFMRTNVITVESRESMPYQEIDLSEYTQLFQVTRSNGTFFEPEEERRLFSFSILYFYTENDGDAAQIYERYAMEPCTKEHLGKFAYLFEDFANLERNYCFPKDFKFNLYGIYGGHKRYSTTYNAVRVCTEGAYGATNCFSEEKIMKEAEDFYVNFSFIDYNVQNSNIDQPGVPYIRTDRIQVGLNFFKRLFYEVNIVDYQTDYGFVFESTKTDSFFTMSNYTLIPDKRAGTSLMATSYVLGRNKINIKRSFEKFQQVLSNIGGAVKALTVMGQLLLVLFTTNTYFFELSHPLKSQIKKVNIVRFTQGQSISQSNIDLGDKKRTISKANQVGFETNLRLLFRCSNQESNKVKRQISELKELMSIEKVVSSLVEVENLKNVLFSREGSTVFEGLGMIQSKKIEPKKAFEELSSKRRNEIEEKLYRLSTKKN